jgi:acyl carrier protein
MNRQEVTSKLKTLIEEDMEIEIKSSAQELNLDSFTMMLIVTFLGEELGIHLKMDQLDFDKFQTLDTFVEMVMVFLEENSVAG